MGKHDRRAQYRHDPSVMLYIEPTTTRRAAQCLYYFTADDARLLSNNLTAFSGTRRLRG
jgi:hypothetical protein